MVIRVRSGPPKYAGTREYNFGSNIVLGRCTSGKTSTLFTHLATDSASSNTWWLVSREYEWSLRQRTSNGICFCPCPSFSVRSRYLHNASRRCCQTSDLVNLPVRSTVTERSTTPAFSPICAKSLSCSGERKYKFL